MAQATRLTCPDPECDYQTKAGLARPDFALRTHTRMRHGPDDASGGAGEASSPSAGSTTDPPPDPSSVDPGEAPQRKKRTLRELLGRPKAPKVEPSTTGEKPPRSAKWGKPKRGRTSVGPLFETIYAGVGRKLELGGGPNVAVGRTLSFQAPIAASRADDMVKGTLVDRIVQPAAKLYDTGEDAFAIAGMPVLVWAWQTFPYARQALNPAMRAAILANLEELAPAMEKAAKREAELTAKLERVAPALFPNGLPTDDNGKPYDIVSAMLFNIFAGVETQAGAEPEVKHNGSGASSDQRPDGATASSGEPAAPAQ